MITPSACGLRSSAGAEATITLSEPTVTAGAAARVDSLRDYLARTKRVMTLLLLTGFCALAASARVFFEP